MKTPKDKLATAEAKPCRYWENLDESDYRSMDAYGSTLVRAANTSIDKFRLKLEDDEATYAMRKGAVAHLAVLEPARFQALKAKTPPARPGDNAWRPKHLQTAFLRCNGDCATAGECPAPDDLHSWECVAERKTETGTTVNSCQKYADRDGFDKLLEHYQQDGVEYDPDADIPSRDVLEDAERCRDTLLEHPQIEKSMFEESRSEVSVRWYEKRRDLSIPLKGRIDIEIRLPNGKSILGDLKTGRSDPSPHQFKRKLSRYKSHAQAAGYSRGYEIVTGRDVVEFFYIATQYDPPHHTWMYVLGDEWIEAGRERYLDGVSNISKVHEDPDCYGGPSDEIVKLDNPKPWRL